MSARMRKRPLRRSRKEEERRKFLRAALVAVGLFLLQPLVSLAGRLRSGPPRLRPPGALPEPRFLGACIKCGQCVQVCPVQAPRLADATDGLGTGTPYIDAREQACDFSCDALSCILACPTEALSHVIKAKEEVRAGFARLSRPQACLARQGKGFRGRARGEGFTGRLRYAEIDRWHPLPMREHPYDREICDLCVLQCPIGLSALRLSVLKGAEDGSDEVARFTPEVLEGCVGCGVCEMTCPADPPAITVDARSRPTPRNSAGTPAR